jgi:protein transport protein SEC23
MTAENKVAEILQHNTTVEYILDNTPRSPIFYFVIDLCIHEEEVEALKSCIMQNLMIIPENSLVGLITFGKYIQVYEMAFDECPKSHVFNSQPKKEHKSADIARLLGIKAAGDARAQAFITPLSVCEGTLNAIFDDMMKDTFKPTGPKRAECAAGAALNIAIGLMEATRGESHGRILSFLGTPPTVGAGTIVSLELKETIRSHHDIVKNKATHFKTARTYYEGLAARAVAANFTIDIFACCQDQIGLTEMRSMVEKTGGYLVLDDSFTKGVFSGSFRKIFGRDESTDVKNEGVGELAMAFMAQFQILTSKEFKVSGAIGNCSSLDRKNNAIGKKVVGIGDTSAWSLGALDRNTTLALYFEMAFANPDDLRGARQGYVQFLTTYRGASGKTFLRVTTVSKTFANHADQQGKGYLRSGFDQEAAAVLVSRLAVWKSQTETISEVRNYLDRTLIKACKTFASYTPGQVLDLYVSSWLSRNNCSQMSQHRNVNIS